MCLPSIIPGVIKRMTSGLGLWSTQSYRLRFQAEQVDPSTMTEVEEHNAALEKVTDFVEEKELDTEQTQNALSSLADPAQALLPANESRCAYEIDITLASVITAIHTYVHINMKYVPGNLFIVRVCVIRICRGFTTKLCFFAAYARFLESRLLRIRQNG